MKSVDPDWGREDEGTGAYDYSKATGPQSISDEEAANTG